MAEQAREVDAGNVIYINPDQMQELADGITNLVEGIRQDKQQHRQVEVRKSRVKEEVKGIKDCDGLIAEEVREWIDSIDLALMVVGDIPGSVIKLITGSTSGSLRKEIERFLQQQPDRANTPWNVLKTLIRNSFLSPNEEDKLKIEVERFQQSSHESVPVFNRKYRELANKAYILPRSADAERILIRAYVKALRNTELAKRTMVDGQPITLEQAMTFTEGQASGMELFDSLDRKEREEEPMEVGALSETASSLNNALRGLTEAVRDMTKNQDRLNTRLAKLEADKNGERKVTTGNRYGKWTAEGRPIYNYCEKVGHKRAECYQLKAAQKTESKN